MKYTSSLVAIAKEISKRFSDQVKNVKYTFFFFGIAKEIM